MLKIRVVKAMLRVTAAAVISLLVAFSAVAQAVRYIHTDGLGSVVLTTDKDRNIVERSEYEPYGSLLNRPMTDGPGYTGHVTDAATGLTYMQQRYYDPAIGRFLSIDPVSVSPVNGLNFSRYWYASNNPYKNTDPDGRCDGPSTCAIDRDIAAMNRGEMSRGEFMDRSEARAAGAAIGVGLIALSRAPVAAPGMLAGAKSFFTKLLASKVVLTRAQQQATKKIENIISNNAKPHDFAGVRNELKGVETGFDHVTEMKNSVTGLKDAVKSLQGSLNNPNLTTGQRTAIEGTVKRATETMDKMKGALSGE